MSEIKPALSAEEWASVGPWTFEVGGMEVTRFTDHSLSLTDRSDVGKMRDGADCVHVRRSQLHALAALCLHGQPFGFTWEDVEILRLAQEFVDLEAFDSSRRRALASLADLIEALLPPEEG